MTSRGRYIRRGILAVCVVVAAQTGIGLARAATIPSPTDLLTSPGTVSAVGGSWKNTLSYTEPEAITATVSVPNKNYGVTAGDTVCMDTSCSWWCACGPTSDTNLATAYTPTSIKGTDGVSWTWRSSKCNPGTYPTRVTTVVTCEGTDTVTITFDKPVSNVVFHLHNLGGNQGGSGFDNTFFSEWTLTSGQDIQMLSGSSTNITLAGKTIKNKNTPQDLDAKVATGSAPFPDYANGTGSGSFQVLGYDYTEIEFGIAFKVALVNDTGTGTPAYDNNIPEGVMIQLSMYKEAFEAPADGEDPTPELDETGVDAGSLWLALAAMVIGAATFVAPRRRRRA